VHGESCSPIRSFFVVVSFAPPVSSLYVSLHPCRTSVCLSVNSPPNDRDEHRATRETRHSDPHARTIVAIVKDPADHSRGSSFVSAGAPSETRGARAATTRAARASTCLSGSLLTFLGEVSLANADSCRQFPFQRDRRTRLTRVVRTERGTLGRHVPLPRDIRGMADTWHHVSSPHCEHGEQPRGYSTTSCDLPVVARPHAHER